jgi:hypothetical protein
MPEVRRQPIATPVFALILIAMLGSSGIACACALLALDVSAETHHESRHELHEKKHDVMSHRPADAGEQDDCGSACGTHSATAVNSKAPIAADYHPEKPAAPAANPDNATEVPASALQVRRWYEEQHLPLSTPVSRYDTLLD